MTEAFQDRRRFSDDELVSNDRQFPDNGEWTVEKVMNRHPLVVTETTRVLTVVHLMARHKVGQVLVVPASWQPGTADEKPPEPIGIFTERDLIRSLSAHPNDLVAMQIGQVMTSPLMVLGMKEDLQAAVNLMFLLRVRRIPVVDQGHLMGIVTRGQVMEAQRQRLMQIEQTNEKLEQQVVSDPLTGLANRLLFDQVLRREVTRREKQNGQVLVIMLDIDHFKRVNDTWGHPVGDQVLRQISGIFRKNVRRADLVARLGGEEFGVIISHRLVMGAEMVAEKLRRKVEMEVFGEEGETFPVTVSAGVAQFVFGEDDMESIVRRADEALYQAKRDGRNRVAVAGRQGENA